MGQYKPNILLFIVDKILNLKTETEKQTLLDFQFMMNNSSKQNSISHSYQMDWKKSLQKGNDYSRNENM